MQQCRSSSTPAQRRQSGLSPGLSFALGIWTLVHLVSGSVAQAQCNTSSNPAPRPPAQANFSDQTFTPAAPYGVGSFGIPGCVGRDGGDNENGVNGSPGQPAGQISSTDNRLTIVGGVPLFGGTSDTFGANILSMGGSGGAGGQAGGGTPFGNFTQGGNGGTAGAGGNIMATFNGSFVPDPKTGLATYGLFALSAGSTGGAGGEAQFGDRGKQAGNGGPGALGGSVALTASGSVQADQFGVWAQSRGGTGGNGGNATTGNKFLTTQGGNGGMGGQAGSVSLNWLSGLVKSAGSGLVAVADGGAGGNGGLQALPSSRARVATAVSAMPGQPACCSPAAKLPST
jgi:hypothetical protein